MAEASTEVKSGVLRKFDIISGKNDNVEIMVDEKPRYEEVRKNAVDNLTKILATFKEDKENGMKTLDIRIQGLDKRILDFYSEFHAMRKAFEDTLKQTEARMNDAVMKLEKRIEKERDFLMSDLSNIIAEAYDTAQVKPAGTPPKQQKR
jgi:predicted  nucleic acid-binding Zn-ribbon protein